MAFVTVENDIAFLDFLKREAGYIDGVSPCLDKGKHTGSFGMNMECLACGESFFSCGSAMIHIEGPLLLDIL